MLDIKYLRQNIIAGFGTLALAGFLACEGSSPDAGLTSSVTSPVQSAVVTVSVGRYPSAVAVNPVTNKIYIGGYGTVTVINGATNATTTVDMRGGDVYDVAVNPVTNTIYVASSYDYDFQEHAQDVLMVIDGATNNTHRVAMDTRTVEFGDYYFMAVAVNTVTNKVYVISGPEPGLVGAKTYGMVYMIDGATNNHARYVAAGGALSAVAVNPVTNKIYVADYGNKEVMVIDGATDNPQWLDAGNYYPIAVAVNPVTNKVYVANSGAALHPSAVTVIDGATNAMATVTTVPLTPFAMALNSVTNKVYAASGYTMTVIDGATNTTTTVAVGDHPFAMAVNQVTNRIYVTDYYNDTVTVIDGATNTTTTVSVGDRPVAVAVNPVTNKVYVVNSRSDTVTVIDGE